MRSHVSHALLLPVPMQAIPSTRTLRCVQGVGGNNYRLMGYPDVARPARQCQPLSHSMPPVWSAEVRYQQMGGPVAIHPVHAAIPRGGTVVHIKLSQLYVLASRRTQLSVAVDDGTPASRSDALGLRIGSFESFLERLISHVQPTSNATAGIWTPFRELICRSSHHHTSSPAYTGPVGACSPLRR